MEEAWNWPLCGHAFHPECVTPVTQRHNPRCPLCRGRFPGGTLPPRLPTTREGETEGRTIPPRPAQQRGRSTMAATATPGLRRS
eukprot:959062-Prorocentrum_lima.AAC.1